MLVITFISYYYRDKLRTLLSLDSVINIQLKNQLINKEVLIIKNEFILEENKINNVVNVLHSLYLK